MQKYGRDHVAYVGNKTYYSGPLILRDLGQVLDVPPHETHAVTKPFKSGTSIHEIIETKDPKIQAYFKKYPEMREQAPKLEGAMEKLGTHAGGIVITDEKYPVPQYFGLQRPNDKNNALALAWDKEEAEAAGLTKYDFLQTKAAGLIHYAKELIDKDPYGHWDEADSEMMKEVAWRGYHKNIFQFESHLGEKAFVDLLPLSVTDISNASGIIRMLGNDSGRRLYDQYKENVAKYQEGETEYWKNEMLRYINEKWVADICVKNFSETYGIMIYQEQLMQLAEDISGGNYTFDMGNVLRKQTEKFVKKYGTVDEAQGDIARLKEWHEKFIEIFHTPILQYLGKDGYDSPDPVVRDFLAGNLKGSTLPVPSNGIVATLVACSVYLFAKPHSIAYAVVAFQEIWFKHHHPVDFWLSSLICNRGASDRIAKYAAAMRQETDIEILRPCVNKSGPTFRKDGKNIRYGLESIQGIGEKTADAIYKARGAADGKFISVEDFIVRVPGNKVNKNHIAILIKVGAFADFGTVEDCWEQAIEFGKALDPDENLQERTLVEFEHNKLGMNITFIDDLVKEARKHGSYPDLEEFNRATIVVRCLKKMNAKTGKGKPYQKSNLQCVNTGTEFWAYDFNQTIDLNAGRTYKLFFRRNPKNGFINIGEPPKKEFWRNR